MPQSDRQIPEKDRCQTCGGTGWTSWSEEGSESKWIVCRECIGTGRTDKNGRKRNKPE
ncbi:MAG TPA: hypothetical protein VH025_03045 [Solirubrobacteraceae bacterium]|nr:hypothetical protein [Solirubrobacteraceae bacterium]